MKNNGVFLRKETSESAINPLPCPNPLFLHGLFLGQINKYYLQDLPNARGSNYKTKRKSSSKVPWTCPGWLRRHWQSLSLLLSILSAILYFCERQGCPFPYLIVLFATFQSLFCQTQLPYRGIAHCGVVLTKQSEVVARPCHLRSLLLTRFMRSNGSLGAQQCVFLSNQIMVYSFFGAAIFWAILAWASGFDL